MINADDEMDDCDDINGDLIIKMKGLQNHGWCSYWISR